MFRAVANIVPARVTNYYVRALLPPSAAARTSLYHRKGQLLSITTTTTTTTEQPNPTHKMFHHYPGSIFTGRGRGGRGWSGGVAGVTIISQRGMASQTGGDNMRCLAKDAEGKLLQKVLEIVRRDRLVNGIDTSKKVIDFKHPEELKAILDLKIGSEGRSVEEAAEVLEKVTHYSVKTQHPYFLNQQFHGIDEVALTGAWMTEALNTNQHTFEAAPVFTLVEVFMIDTLVNLYGWSQGDGIFSPGGSMSNMYGMMLARHKRHPDVKMTGVSSMKPLIAFTSDQSHYSCKKAALYMGIGLNNVVAVQTDSWGRMIPEALKKAVQEARARGGEPFYVNASCGTTVLGSCDPLNELADVCQEENLWLHVDACWAGAAILSKKHKHVLDGVERVDSLSWNPHKMIGAPLQCSVFIVKHKGLLHECNSLSATYLFQQDKFYDVSYDMGDKSFQCGRKVDAFKLYLLFSLHGLNELERRVDAAHDAASYLCDETGKRDSFRLVLDKPQVTNVCFWFIPPSMRGKEENSEWWQQLAKVAPKVKARMVEKGSLMVGYQPVREKGLVNFFRVVTTSYPVPTQQDMDFVLDEIERLGADL